MDNAAIDAIEVALMELVLSSVRFILLLKEQNLYSLFLIPLISTEAHRFVLEGQRKRRKRYID